MRSLLSRRKPTCIALLLTNVSWLNILLPVHKFWMNSEEFPSSQSPSLHHGVVWLFCDIHRPVNSSCDVWAKFGFDQSVSFWRRRHNWWRHWDICPILSCVPDVLSCNSNGLLVSSFRLKITNLGPQDTGFYTCEGFNQHGMQKTTGVLQVHPGTFTFLFCEVSERCSPTSDNAVLSSNFGPFCCHRSLPREIRQFYHLKRGTFVAWILAKTERK